MKKLFFDLFPIILFFTAYQIAEKNAAAATAFLTHLGFNLAPGQKPGVFIATLAAILATFAQIAWIKLRGRRIDNMLWVSLILIVVFGGATLIFHDENVIKWKPTVLYMLFATLLAGAPRFSGKNLIRLMMENQLSLPDPVWTRLNQLWAGFFAFMAVTNSIVALQFSTETWVNFKMFGTLGLMLLFVFAQGVFLARHIRDPS